MRILRSTHQGRMRISSPSTTDSRQIEQVSSSKYFFVDPVCVCVLCVGSFVVFVCIRPKCLANCHPHVPPVHTARARTHTHTHTRTNCLLPRGVDAGNLNILDMVPMDFNLDPVPTLPHAETCEICEDTAWVWVWLWAWAWAWVWVWAVLPVLDATLDQPGKAMQTRPRPGIRASTGGVSEWSGVCAWFCISWSVLPVSDWCRAVQCQHGTSGDCV